MTTMIEIWRRQVQTYPLFMTWVMFLGILVAIGLGSGAIVLWQGLEVTNLTDRVPWGLWITVDLSAIALGAGAFSLSAVAFIFRVKSF